MNNSTEIKPDTNESHTTFITLMTVNIAITILGLNCHLMGIYIINRINRPTNQHVILLHLSLSEVVIQVLRMPNQVLYAILKHPEHNSFFNVCFTISGMVIVPPYILIMMVMSLDRALMVILKTRYHHIFNRKKIKTCLICCWLIGVLPGGLCQILYDFDKRQVIRKKYIAPLMTCIFLVHTVIMYAIIFIGYYKVRKSLLNIHTKGATARSSLLQLRLKTPTLIFITFIILMNIPSFLDGFIADRRSGSAFVGLCYSLGILTDTLIYTYCNVTIRNRFKQMCRVTVAMRDARLESVVNISVISANEKKVRKRPIISGPPIVDTIL